MHRVRKGIASVLILRPVMVLPALADDKKEHWEYGARRGYGVPKISAADAKQTVQES